MERLTERTRYGIVGNNDRVINYPLYKIADADPLDRRIVGQCFEKLAQYEDAEEQGLLLRLPCKVGDTVYCIEKRRTKCTAYDEEYRESSCLGCECACDSKVYYEVVETEAYGVGWILSNVKEFGKIIFLTKEEAEKELERLKNNE